MTTLKDILHVLADGISLSGPVREQLHADIDAHDQATDQPAEPDSADRHDDVSRETPPPAPATPFTQGA